MISGPMNRALSATNSWHWWPIPVLCGVVALALSLTACSVINAYETVPAKQGGSAGNPTSNGGGPVGGGQTGGGQVGGQGGSVDGGNGGTGGNAGAAPGELYWCRRFGNSATQVGKAVATDHWGNVIVAGVFAGAVQFGSQYLASHGGHDFFIAKIDPLGNVVWARRYGDTADQCPSLTCKVRVAPDPAGNIAFAASYHGSVTINGIEHTSIDAADVLLVELDSDGNRLRSFSYGGTNSQFVEGLAVDEVGDIVLAGGFNSSISFGTQTLNTAGGFDIFLATVDDDDAFQWAESYGALDAQIARAAAVASGSRNIAIAGTFGGTLTFESDVHVGPNGGTSIFLAKFLPYGPYVWSLASTNTGSPNPTSVAFDDVENLVMTGSFAGTLDFGGQALQAEGKDDVFLAKFDSTGQPLWSKRYGAVNNQDAGWVAVDDKGYIVIAGSFETAIDFGGTPLIGSGGYDIYLAKFKGNSQHQWSKGFGDGASQRAEAIAVDGDNNIVMTGAIDGTVDFGAGPTSPEGGGLDIFVAKFGP